MDPFTIIYEDEKLLVINKACGVEYHGEKGIVQLLRKVLGREVYGIHRLDRETSGLMVFAKNKEIQSAISKLFQTKDVQKFYLALSNKRPSKKQGTIKGDLSKGRGGNYYLKKTFNNPSITKFVSRYDEVKQLRVFLLRPFTGKTHQLRVVLKSLGANILGDTRYGGEDSDRMYLDACILEFVLDSKKYSFTNTIRSGQYFQNISEAYIENLKNELIS